MNNRCVLMLSSQKMKRVTTMSKIRKTIIGMLACTLLCLAGCGQKGNLYLPGQKDASLLQHHNYQIS